MLNSANEPSIRSPWCNGPTGISFFLCATCRCSATRYTMRARSSNILKALIAENQQAAIWSMAIVPTDSVSETVPDVSLTDAMKLAIENRPELQQLKLAREINQIDQSYFRNQTRPEIDLTGTYGAVGAAGTLTSTTSPFTASTNLL